MKVAESKISKRLQTVVPPAVRSALGLGIADYIEWHIEDQRVEVRKKEVK